MQGTQVTFTIPEGAPPGTLLSVPVRGGAEQVKVRVPDGVGPGSKMILTQPEGTEEWNMQLGSVNPTEHDDRAYDDRAYDDPQARQYDQQELPPERQQDAYDQYDQCANQYDQYGERNLLVLVEDLLEQEQKVLL